MKLWLFTRRAASVLAASAALCACAVVYGQTISVWQADVCDKIFPETPAGEETPPLSLILSGSRLSFQRLDRSGIKIVGKSLARRPSILFLRSV